LHDQVERSVASGARVVLGGEVPDELAAGNCFVKHAGRLRPATAVRGLKQSGFGRELADLGLERFVNTKTVVAA
jgi:acyl-CoA reductase-like NAD-dependent aldehyde dehydrogenase